jgi:hypothetical protein
VEKDKTFFASVPEYLPRAGEKIIKAHTLMIDFAISAAVTTISSHWPPKPLQPLQPFTVTTLASASFLAFHGQPLGWGSAA